MALKKAVICDDDRTTLSILRRVLEKRGFEVAAAENGEEALMLLKESPQLLVLDLDMPVKGGIDLLKDMKDRAQSARYIIVLSNHEGQDKRGEARALGAHETLIKPFKPSELGKKIEVLIAEGKI